MAKRRTDDQHINEEHPEEGHFSEGDPKTEYLKEELSQR
jgi:hypothetical protein